MPYNMTSFVCLAVAFALLQGAASLNNGLGRTPQMGWNSWNHFHCGINATILEQSADAMVRARHVAIASSESVAGRLQ